MTFLLDDVTDLPATHVHPFLQDLPHGPERLFLIGEPAAHRPLVAVVGSRRASGPGRRQAFRLGRELAERGLSVVSGLARGIDAAAMEGCLAGGGHPVGVLGNGLPEIYPLENSELALRVVRGGGALISEFPPGAPPRRSHFPRRNRLISGLALGVVVVEAAMRSGSLITACWALDQGREVLVYPGPAEGPSHTGCHHLIRDGAVLVTNADEVILGLVEGFGARGDLASADRAIRAGAGSVAEIMEQSGVRPTDALRAWVRHSCAVS